MWEICVGSLQTACVSLNSSSRSPKERKENNVEREKKTVHEIASTRAGIRKEIRNEERTQLQFDVPHEDVAH